MTSIGSLGARALLAILLALAAPLAQAQDNRLLPVGDWAYDYISRLQRRGHMLELNPTSSPYRRGEVRSALAKVDSMALGESERHWWRLLSRAFPRRKKEEVVVGYAVQVGARAINSDRLDVVRPLGDTLRFYWAGTLASAYADLGGLVAEVGLWQDRYYEDDPDGLDTALRLFVRSEHTYAGYASRLFSAYVGRWSQHWGAPGEVATLLSGNPRSQDQIVARFGGRRFAVTSVLSELDSITGASRFTGRAADDSVRVGNRRRYLAAHRWDYRPTRGFMVSFMESVLYSGANAGLSLKYLNPMHPFLFVVDNTPKNDENNGFLAGLLWAQVGRLTLHGQLMVDDLNVQRGTGNETITFALAGSAIYALPAMDLSASLVAVAARAYNAPQPEGKYIYLRRGLGTQFSDYVHASAMAEAYLDRIAPGLRLAPRIDLLLQGERDIRAPFPANDEVLDNILDGEVQRTVRGSLQISYQRAHWWWVRLDGGVNMRGPQERRFIGLIEVGVRRTFHRALRLSFK